MTRRIWGLIALTAALAVTTVAATAQDPVPDPNAGERAGSTVGRATDRLRQGVRDTAESLRGQFAKARSSVYAMGVHARLYSRLHWDKTLNDATDLDADVDRAGVVTLKGGVADAKARARAIDLADSTVGVTRVVDQLTIRPPTAGGTTTTTTTTETKTTTTRPRPPQP